ncbi:leucine-rich repeat serine/threonine-protein kinase 1-like isoform X2 [Oculina patagonica]
MSKGVIKQLHEACRTGNLDTLLQAIYYNHDIVQELICGGEADDNCTSPRNFLHMACENGHLDVVRQLVDFGADVNQIADENGTPLCVACMKGHADIAQFLLSKGALVHDPALGNSSPILLACKSGKHEVVEFLLSEEPLLLRTHGQLLLYEACRLGHGRVVRLLIKKGVDVDPPLVALDSQGGRVPGSPLQGACVGRQTAIVNYLIENGAKVTCDIVEKYWELIGDALMRYTKETRNKRKTTLSFEVDPTVTMFSAAWDRKNLYALHKAWFVNLSARLVSIELSENHLEELPDELFNILPALEVLDVSKNKLEYLPEVISSYTRIQKLSANDNELKFVPASLLQIPTLKKLHLARNNITSLCGDPNDSDELGSSMTDSETWGCTALKVLSLSYNKLECLPRGIQGAIGLTKLLVDHNKLRDFPMPWKCPLEILDLSHNNLSHFSCNLEMVWSSSLKRLNLSNNHLGTISWNVCQLMVLQDLDLSHNSIRLLPKPEFWRCSTLHKFNLSYNKLSAKPLVDPQATSPKRFPFSGVFKTTGQEDSQDIKTDCEFPASLLAPTLETLLLSDNNLQVVPVSICGLMSLIELDLSNNPDLRTLPPELGNLRECWQLRLNKLYLPGIPKHVRPGENGVRPKDTLAYLRATLRKSVPYYRMKLMVVGMQGRGKTTLLAALKGQKLPPNLSTVGIVIDEWQVQMSSSSRFTLQRFLTQSDAPLITFSTWDLAGQNVYYAAHQMFLSPNTLYLAVWNVTHGEEGVESLRRWLLNIQARAPFSEVLIVGTHLDLLPKKNRQARVDALKHSIAVKYLDNQGFPKIVGNIVVSPTTGENIPELREMIYSKALKVKDLGELVIGRRVPQSYTDLQQAVIQEAERRRSTGEPPILLEDEILQLAKSSPQNDILDTEELTLATRFLHENGILLHYNDQLRGLNHLYFIDPAWVCDLIATLVTIRERNPFIVNGVMKKKDLELVLRDPKFPEDFIPQYLQLMERFEIALSLNDEQLLVPSMLPKEKPGMQLHQLQKMIAKRRKSDEKAKMSSSRRSPVDNRSISTVRRNYQMAYTPSGFWSRLITRLMVSVQRWRAVEHIKEESYSLVFWREGIGVVYEGGHFQVESYHELIPVNQGKAAFQEINGIAITVWSEQRDFAALGFIVDQVDALISEWYPGLDETDMYGLPLVRRLIPCPLCSNLMTQRQSMKRSVSMEYIPNFNVAHPPRPYNFTLPTCAATALSFSTIACPYHPDRVVSLHHLIPDLLMADLPRHLLADPSQFKFEARESQRIGGGGSGEVYRGTYRDEAVAVKTFHSTTQAGGLGNTGPSPGSRTLGGSFYQRAHQSEGSSMRRSDVFSTLSEDDMEEELEKTKVVKAFWDLRQEVAVLCRLNHPSVVRLLAVSLHPLCFVLELAPYGSLASVLDELSSKREAQEKEGSRVSRDQARESILGRQLSYKIAFQVASAIWYLHDCDIIYRDLKADNVLVWSLDESSLLNVKLSDYGISCFATPQGVAGEEGTPGYQAPEIRTGVGYDEKVDIFSFAIFVFELLTGCRPFREYRNIIDIKKAIRRGVRPSLESCDLDTQIPRLEGLMRSCWHQLPEKRPPASEILQQMEEPSFLCQCRLVPATNEGLLEKVTTIHGLSPAGPGNLMASPSNDGPSAENSSGYVLLWSRERENRYYSMVNSETGVFYTHEQKCPGHRVLCMTRVENRTWLGTEGCTVEVFGRRSWRLPSTLWSYVTKAPVLALLTEYAPSDADSPEAAELQGDTSVKNVYASLANGTLVVFTPKTTFTERRFSHNDVTLVTKEEDEHLTRESNKWSDLQVVNLGQNGMPAKSMVLVRDNKELWVGCGNKIVIVDTSTLAVLDEIAVYQTPRTHVRIMVTDGMRVWSADRRSSKILQWEVSNRQLTNIFDCDVDIPVGVALNTDVKEPRRFSSGKWSSERFSGRNRAISDPPGTLNPSYTEAMLKEAMAAFKGSQEGDERESLRTGDSLPREAKSSARLDREAQRNGSIENSDDGDLMSSERTPPVTIPGSKPQFFSGQELEENVLSRFRSLSAETDSGTSVDSGVSSFRSTCTTKSNRTNTSTSASSGAARVHAEDSRTDVDSASVTLTSENVSSVSERTAPLDSNQNVVEQERESNAGTSSKDETRDESTTILPVESEQERHQETSGTLNTESNPIANVTDDRNGTQQALGEDESRRKSDQSSKEVDDTKELEENEAEFELVDREETRQAFIEGTRRQTALPESTSTQQCASMASLRLPFSSSSRAPSLMSSKKRKSQRRQADEGNKSPPTVQPTKPWASRPRLRILAGSINRVTSLLLVNGTLWIGRGIGDVLTMNVNSANNDVPLGHVFAQLECDNLLGYENGQVDEIVNSGTNKVVCLRRLEPTRGSADNEDRFTERYQLVVWEAWGDTEFRKFRTQLDEFNSLVE